VRPASPTGPLVQINCTSASRHSSRELAAAAKGDLDSEALFPYKESPAMTSSRRPLKPGVALPYMEITSCAL